MAYIWRGDLTEGFLRYEFGGAYTWRGLFSKFYGSSVLLLLCLHLFRVIASMIVFHLLMMGVLSLKESFITSAAMVPLPIFTFLFFAFIQQHFVGASMCLSLSMASGLQEASPHFLQVSLLTL